MPILCKLPELIRPMYTFMFMPMHGLYKTMFIFTKHVYVCLYGPWATPYVYNYTYSHDMLCMLEYTIYAHVYVHDTRSVLCYSLWRHLLCFMLLVVSTPLNFNLGLGPTEGGLVLFLWTSSSLDYIMGAYWCSAVHDGILWALCILVLPSCHVMFCFMLSSRSCIAANLGEYN